MSKLKSLVPLAVAAAMGGYSSGALASAFALIEQNASGLGNAYAGAAAAAEDASTIFFNPAGMSLLPGRQVVMAGHLIAPSAKFGNSGTTPAFSTVLGGGPYPLGGNGGDAGDLAFVPNFYLSWQLAPRWHVGLGVGAPFGLKTDYDGDWMGRFHALKSEVKAINVNPSVAYKINDGVSIGFGINYQRLEAELTKAVNYSFVASAAGLPFPPNVSGSQSIEGDDDAWGYNLGVMFNLGPKARVGLAYRSAMSYSLTGSVLFQGRPAPFNAVIGGALGPGAAALTANQVGDSAMSADIKLPGSFSAAVKHQLDPKWELLADATWTDWSSIQSLNIVRTSGVGAGLLESVPLNFKDSWRFGLGANYRYNDAWTWRFGTAYDQTPVQDLFRIPRLPDEDRIWLSIGAQFRMSRQATLDFGFAHLFVKDASLALTGPPAISPAQAAGRGRLIGNYDSDVNILSAQLRYSF